MIREGIEMTTMKALLTLKNDGFEQLTYAGLYSLIRTGKIAPPVKSWPTGDFEWAESDLANVREVLRQRRRRRNRAAIDKHRTEGRSHETQ